ncbi:MAG TPA: SCP2 sterol-binding domain-containing protein [Candidatus Udaeobacter sp.]|nr:SCP2 sterol-binding domain-containing protein [Candidatus Udaeobacter sp.]
MTKPKLPHYRYGRWLFTVISALVSLICIEAVNAASSGHMDSTPQEVFDSMRGSFQPAKAKGVHARYQWDLSGPEGGQWWIDVDDGKYKMGKGKIDNPSVTFVAKDKDWVAVSNHQLGGTWAYLTGRLKIRGDQGLARKLGEIFP